MEVFQYGDLFDYEVVWSRRKTLAIAIGVGGKVVVKAPVSLSQGKIEYYLSQKRNWILKNQAKMELLAEKRIVRKYIDGERFLYKGETYQLIITELKGRKSDVELLEHNMMVAGEKMEAEKIRNLLANWYVSRAGETVCERVEYFSKILGVKPSKVSLRDTKTRWGSCSSAGNVMINWRVIMAPPDILDYVVIHELCHLKEMNHSRNFWKHVEQVMPEWRECRRWLRENGFSLAV